MTGTLPFLDRRRLTTLLLALTLFIAPISFMPGLAPARAADSSVTISAFDRADNSPVTPFRFVVYEDIAHQSEDGTPAWSTNPRSYAPLVAWGDETSAELMLGPGKYLVSVVGGELPPVPGTYKTSGKHFVVDGGGGDVGVAVGLVAGPLPSASIQVEVFHDNASVNGARDIPVEDGLAGFAVLLEDGTGEVSVDIYGNPICTQYDGALNGEFPPGNIVGDASGQCLTDETGTVLIENLGPLKYGVFVNPPNGSGWIQTSTIEGTQIVDVWVQEGADGLLAEQGNLTSLALFGFVQECEFGLCPQLNPGGDPVPPNTPNPPQGNTTITGRIREIAEAGVGDGLGPAVSEPYIALNNLSGNDEQVYTGRGEKDGTFTIENVPPGTYQVVIWDKPLDMIIQYRTVIVQPGDTVIDVGDYGVPRWFGTIQGYAYWDTGIDKSGNIIPAEAIDDDFEGADATHPGAENGFRDCQEYATGPHDVANCEPGIPSQDLDIRFKDGSIKYAAFTDQNGWYSFDEVFPFPSFMIWEVGFGRFKQVGTMSYLTEPGADGAPNVPMGYPYNPENMPGCPRDINGDRDPGCHPADSFGPASLLQGALTFSGTYHWIDTGKVPYPANENGGISGLVIYATTRNEYAPFNAAAEDYEPGVPNVTINLYDAALDGSFQPIPCTQVEDGCPYGEGELKRVGLGAGDIVDSVQTDSWDGNLPADCLYPDLLGGTVQDPDCLEIPKNPNQLKDGVFDGGYAFENVPAGAYIVEMVAPDGYRQIKEEDQNTDQGDEIVPAVPPPPCAGPMHLVNDARNPADGEMTPLCDSKFVRVVNGTNPPAEFYVMTDFDDSVDGAGDPVADFAGTTAPPPPGFIRGTLTDDLAVDFDPLSPNYQSKFGVPNTAIGILDFADNEIAVVNTDDYGFFEVLLPAGTTISCPTPGGICPSMYKVIANYPGQDPLNPNPNWNPNYTTLALPTDVWAGKTTFSDAAITPISAFAGFDNVSCVDTGPDVQYVSEVHGPRGTSFSIYGANFGTTQGQVTIGGRQVTNIGNWSNTQIDLTIQNGGGPSGIQRGARQLLVIDADGVESQTGITFHVTGGNGGNAYNPPIVDVYPSADLELDPSPLQDGIDAAAPGSLIVVHPGTYYELPIVYKSAKLQGFGSAVTSIDGRFFGFGDGVAFSVADWLDKVAGIDPVGPPVPVGQVVTVVAETANAHSNQYHTQIDGFTIIGGDPLKAENGPEVPVQAGGVYAHRRARRLQVSNNLVQSNSGNAGGGVIIGQPYLGNNNNNPNVRIHHNRILNNGGFILAGGVGVFRGSRNYEIDHNQICGNYSAEYGGGISHFGYSDGGSIHDNVVTFNGAFDEGGGIMIGSELPLNPGAVPAGSGEVTIDSNLIQFNFSNDDGGGIRLLAPVDGPVHILNNMIVNNLATDIGGGIALDDALDVEIINNTVARNVSTGSAEDADRSPACGGGLATCAHGAGITSTLFSAAVLGMNPAPATDFSDPLMFNNVIWQNEAFHLDTLGNMVPDPAGARPGPVIDLEVIGTPVPETMTPNHSVLTAPYGSGVGNTIGNPQFVDPVFTEFQALPLIEDPAFVSVQILTTPMDNQGDYHLGGGSPAIDAGMTMFAGIDAPLTDFEGDVRVGNPDAGADEVVP